MKKSKKLIVILSPVLLFLLIWGFSLARCEILTLMHGNEFINFEEVKIAEKFKVIEYTDNFAKVYCITQNMQSGSVHSFVKVNNMWQYNKWEDGGWSTAGNADETIWPFWWHFIYYRGF